MKLLKIFKFEPFGVNIGVIIADPEAFNELIKEWEMPYADTINTSGRWMFSKDESAYSDGFPMKYMIWIRCSPKGAIFNGTVVHELQHAIFAILAQYDCTHQDNTDELYAYYMESLSKSIFEWHKEAFPCYYPDQIAWIFHTLKGELLEKGVEILTGAWKEKEDGAWYMENDALYGLNELFTKQIDIDKEKLSIGITLQFQNETKI